MTVEKNIRGAPEKIPRIVSAPGFLTFMSATAVNSAYIGAAAQTTVPTTAVTTPAQTTAIMTTAHVSESEQSRVHDEGHGDAPAQRHGSRENGEKYKIFYLKFRKYFFHPFALISFL